MSSILNVDTIADKAGTGAVALTKQEACKLRCRYNQATATEESGALNVSSITDAATGHFLVNIQSVMNDSLYSVSGFGGEHGNVNDATWLTKQSTQNDYSTSAIPVATFNYAGAAKDSERDSIIVFGDLA
jgi:hypothetical protein